MNGSLPIFQNYGLAAAPSKSNRRLVYLIEKGSDLKSNIQVSVIACSVR
jgi:hypothetical protein